MKLIKNDILLNKHIQYKLKLVVIMIFLDINKYYLKSVGTSELALLWDRFFSNWPTLKKDSDGASALNQMRFFSLNSRWKEVSNHTSSRLIEQKHSCQI